MKIKEFKTLLWAVAFLVGSFLSGCVDLPENIEPPRYDVELYIPLTDTTYTIADAIEDDSTISVSKDPQTLGMLYFEQVNEISTFKVENNLSINDFSTRFSKKIGSVKINDVKPVKIGIMVEDWANGVSSGSQMVFPENKGDLVVPFKKIEQFESVTLESGILTVSLLNRLPVEIQLQGITIKNAVGGEIIATVPKSQPIVLQPNDSAKVNFDLGGKTVKDSLVYEGTIYTPGSGGQTVTIPSDAGTEIKVSFRDLAISSVTAVLPEQDPFTKTGTVTMDDSTYLQEAVFDSGSFSITFDNNLDLDIRLDLQIDNLKKANGDSYSISLVLGRKEQHKVISEPSLSGWSIISTGAQATNELSYSITVTALPSNAPRSLSKDDSISVAVDFKNIVLRSVTGKIKPTTFSITQSDFDMDMGDVKDKFGYSQINLNDPAIILDLSSSAKMQFMLDASIDATNGTQTKSLALHNVLIDSPGDTRIDLRDYGLKDFLNGFLNELPNHFEFSGSAIVNPNYEVGSVSKDDSIAGSVEIRIPLDVGIEGGNFKDTVNIDPSDMDTTNIDNMNYVELTLEIKNAIPVSIVFTGKFFDLSGNYLFNLPPEGSSSDSLIIPPPTVGNDGFVSSPGVNKQTIKLTGAEAKSFLKGGKIIMQLGLFTPPAGNVKPVKFRDKDWISLKAYAKASVRVETNDGE